MIESTINIDIENDFGKDMKQITALNNQAQIKAVSYIMPIQSIFEIYC